MKGVEEGSAMTFDYVAYTVIGIHSNETIYFDLQIIFFSGGCMTAAGLLNAQPIDIGAAMCIEPVMATSIAAAFGTVVQDWGLIKMGIRNNCVIMVVCLLVGFLYALIGICWEAEVSLTTLTVCSLNL